MVEEIGQQVGFGFPGVGEGISDGDVVDSMDKFHEDGRREGSK